MLVGVLVTQNIAQYMLGLLRISIFGIELLALMK